MEMEVDFTFGGRSYKATGVVLQLPVAAVTRAVLTCNIRSSSQIPKKSYLVRASDLMSKVSASFLMCVPYIQRQKKIRYMPLPHTLPTSMPYRQTIPYHTVSCQINMTYHNRFYQ